MEVVEIKNIDINLLETLFTNSFSKLKDGDSEKFGEDNSQGFREWFGIDYLKDYQKFSHVIVVREQDNIVGGAIVGMQNPLSWPDGRKYELFILGVLPEYRNRGIGKLLVDRVEVVSKREGAQCVILNTHELMTDTQKFYTNLGYVKIGVLNDYYGNGKAVFFQKKL